MNSSSESMVVSGGVLRAVGDKPPIFPAVSCFFLTMLLSSLSAALRLRVWGGVVSRNAWCLTSR